MSSTPARHSVLVQLAALVVVIAGLKAAESIVIPILVSLFIAIICAPPVFWFKRKGAPGALAILIVVSLIVLAVGLVVLIIGSSVDEFQAALPQYQASVQAMSAELIATLKGWGLPIPEKNISSYISPGAAMGLVGNVLGSLSNILGNLLMILFMVVFILLEAFHFREKFRSAVKSEQAENAFMHFADFTAGLNKYLSIKTLISLSSGILVTIGTWAIGLDFPFVWGLLAFLFNYIPTIGSIMSSVPAILLALVSLGWQEAVGLLVMYLAIEMVMGSLIEPRVMGKGVGLSTLVVFVALVFWGWLFGPIGMLLSIPLTMAVKIFLANHEDTLWLSKLLGQGH